MAAMIALCLAVLCAGCLAQPVLAETVRQTMEGSMDVEITWPSDVVAGRDFSVSFLIQNNGWEDKQDVSVRFGTGGPIVPAGPDAGFDVPEISAGGSYGTTAGFSVPPGAPPGQHFLNVGYSQVLLENNEISREPTRTDIALPINVKDRPGVVIRTAVPESIFAQAEFPFTVSILSEDVDLADVAVRIMPPGEIEFWGETLHTFSSVRHGEPVSITSRVITPREEIRSEYRVPFQVTVSYTDDTGERMEDSRTVSPVLRPRTFMELTTDGGIWVGSLFIAPYVSVGTIVGIPAGVLLSLIVKRRRGR